MILRAPQHGFFLAGSLLYVVLDERHDRLLLIYCAFFSSSLELLSRKDFR